MTDTTVNVSGADAVYGIDAVRVGSSGDYRQVLVVGDFTSSGITGSMASVESSALYVSAQVTPGKGSYLTASGFNLSAAASLGAQATATFIDAPGANKRLVVYGVQVSTRGSGSASYAQYYIHAGTSWETGQVWGGQHIGKTSMTDSATFPYGVSLAANTALSTTTVEGSTNIYLIGTIYYRIEDV